MAFYIRHQYVFIVLRYFNMEIYLQQTVFAQLSLRLMSLRHVICCSGYVAVSSKLWSMLAEKDAVLFFYITLCWQHSGVVIIIIIIIIVSELWKTEIVLQHCRQ